MELNKIKEIIKDYVESKNLKLFDVSYFKSDSILTVLLDEKLSIDEIEVFSNGLSEYLDKYEDEFEDNYFLDVSNVGVERPIRNEEELNDAIGSYIYVKTKENEYYGTLKSYTDGIIHLITKVKNRTSEVSVDYKKAKKVRYAVEF